MQVAIGDAVEVWSQSNQAWVNGHVSQVFTETLNINGQVFPAGTIEVTYVNGAKKAVPPEHLGTFVRKSQSAIGYAPQPVAGEDSASDSSSGSESEAESSAESQASSKSDGSKAAGPDSSSTSKQELQEAIKKLEEEDRVDLEDPVALAAFLVTANIKLIRAEYLVHLVTEDRRLPRRQEAEGENFVDSAGKTRSALVDHEEVEAWAAGSKEAIIASVSHAWEAREHPDPCGYQLEMVAQHASLFVAAFAAEIWLFFDYVSLFQFKREKETEEQSFRRSMQNMHAMYAHESTMTFRVESLTPEQRWQNAIQDGLQVKIFHEKSGLIQPVSLEDSENLKQNPNLYFDRGWCRAEMSWSSVRGDTAQNQRVDLEVAVKEKVIDTDLAGRTPVAPDAFAYDMNSAVFTHRSDADAVIELQKKVFLEKVTKRRKLKVEGISLQQMQALTQSLRHFKQLKSITINDFRCGDSEARAFVEALATTPIKKISCKTRDQSILDCLVKAMAGASKTLKITHLDVASESGFIDWAQLGASGAEAIAVFLKSTTTLVNLDLSLNELRNEGAEVLAEALKENRTLKRLNLAENDIGVEGVQALQQALETNTTLEHLELHELFSFEIVEAINAAYGANPRIHNPWTVLSEASDGSEEQALKSPFEAAVRIKGLAAELRLNRIITELNLSKKNICDEQLKALAEAFRVNKTIKEVILSSNQIGDEGVKALAEAFRVNKTIKEVFLSSNQIGDEGVKALAEAFRVNKTIKEVFLSNNQIGDEGVEALAEAIRVNKTIETVNLSYNQIGDEGVKALASAMEINETITVVNLPMNDDQLAMLSDEGRQALEDIERFCSRNFIHLALQDAPVGSIVPTNAET